MNPVRPPAVASFADTSTDPDERSDPPTLPSRSRTPRDEEPAERSEDEDARELGAANRMLMRRLDRALDQTAAGLRDLKATVERGDARVAGAIEKQMGRMILVVQIGGFVGFAAAVVLIVMLILILSGLLGVDPAQVAGGTSTVVGATADAVRTVTASPPQPAQPGGAPPPPDAPPIDPPP